MHDKDNASSSVRPVFQAAAKLATQLPAVETFEKNKKACDKSQSGCACKQLCPAMLAAANIANHNKLV